MELAGFVLDFCLMLVSPQGDYKMAKYGLFTAPGGKAVEVVEGDEMQQNKQWVKILKKPQNPDDSPEVVATFNLGKGQYVKKIKD